MKRIITLSLFVTIVALSCDSAAKSGKTNSAADTLQPSGGVSRAATAVPASASDSIPMLYLTEAEFKQLPKGENRKFRFEFCKTTGNSYFNLLIYPMKNRKQDGNALFMHNELRIWPLVLSNRNTNILGSQKLTKDEIGKVLKALDTAGNQFVIFYPQRDFGNSHLYYDVYVMNELPTPDSFKAFTTTGKLTSTNPSPPASEENESVN